MILAALSFILHLLHPFLSNSKECIKEWAHLCNKLQQKTWLYGHKRGYEASKTQICLFPIMHLDGIPIPATKTQHPSPTRGHRGERPVRWDVGEKNIPESTDSGVKKKKKSNNVVWEIFKRARYRLIIRCCTSVLKKQIPLDFCRSLVCSKNPVCFLFISLCISFLSLPVHHGQKCSLI